MQKKRNFLFVIIISLIHSVSFAQYVKIDTALMIEDLRKLSHDAAEGRKTGTDGAEAARRFITKQMDALGIKDFKKKYRHDFEFESRNGQTIEGINIIGYINGVASDSAFVVTAHYDHLGVVDGQIYNGADDNASGVAGMLAIMEYFERNPPRHNIIFAALDAEEMGLQGAKALVADSSRVPMHLARLNINLDMISVSDENELYAVGTAHYPKLKPILENLDLPTIKLKFGHDTGEGSDNWTYASDHGAFHRAGIPFIYFGVEDHANYHKPTDTFENIDTRFYVRSVSAILDCIIALDANLN